MLRRIALAAASGIWLASCADPHFIHDPQIGYFDRQQLPLLLKSLRCELATYVAANNQRKILNTAFYKTNPLWADQAFPFFPMDPSKFGGISLELKIQDTLGTQSGTTADWKRTYDALRTRVWHISPTLGEQNSYDLLTGFLLPQDIYGLDESDLIGSAEAYDQLSTRPDLPYLCYKQIPWHPGRYYAPDVYNEIFVEQDLDELAKGKSGQPQFERIRVNAGLPLAAWLLDVGTTLSTTTLTPMPRKSNEEIIPGQMTYTFTIQTTAGLDVRNTISTSLWTSLGGEISGAFQHTGIMTLVLNGVDSIITSGVKVGNAVRISSTPIKQTTISVPQFCLTPEIGKLPVPGYQSGNNCHWPPQPFRPRLAVSGPRRPSQTTPERELKELVPAPDLAVPRTTQEERKQGTVKPQLRPEGLPAPAARPYLDKPHGTILYPSPLTPLGTQ
jgi:hypothetical protein